MVTPKSGVFDSLPLNGEGRKVGMSWDPAKDEAAGEACRAYTAANVMRLPAACTSRGATRTRCRSTRTPEHRRGCCTSPPRGQLPRPSWQGHSVGAVGVRARRGRGAARLGNLKVVTTNLRAGYVRKNGAPHSDKAVVTEYFDLNTLAERRRVDDDHDEGRRSGLPSLSRRPTSRLPTRGLESVALFGHVGSFEESLGESRQQRCRLGASVSCCSRP